MTGDVRVVSVTRSRGRVWENYNCEELHPGNRRSARRVVGRDLTESGVGSAVLCPGYMFLHLSCECEVGAGSISVGSCAVGEVGGRVVSRHPSDFAWRVVVGGERGGHEGGSARAP
jgi:hypothetical protein